MIKDMVEYDGLIDNPESLQLKYFTQTVLKDIMAVSSLKPDIQQIIKVMADIKIESSRIITTPKGYSADGQMLTGKKLIVDGFIDEKVEYMADEPSQSVHAAYFRPHFSTSIAIPDTVMQIINVFAYIEDASAEVLEDKRNISISISSLIDAMDA